jgi:hypothetical protein
LGFLSNAREERILKEEKTQERIAKAVSQAVQAFRKKILERKMVPALPSMPTGTGQ